MDIPVYLFTGFLESGKTRFIQETLEDKRFNNGEKTLLLLCEEGVEEYDPARFFGKNVFIEPVQEESDLSEKLLLRLQKQHSADRVLVEYNGMWQLKSLFNALPKSWIIAQEFMFAETATFVNYNNNMRSLVVDKLNSCELVVFNRYSEKTAKEQLHKIVRAVNTRATIAYEYPDGKVEYDDIEDPLPFDRDAQRFTVQDKDYAYFYRDLSENLDFYNGKTVTFKAVAAKNRKLKGNELVVGRHLMTCCVEDITFAGLLAECPPELTAQNREWIMLTALIKVEYCELYGQRGPVLYVDRLAKADPPEEEVVTFY